MRMLKSYDETRTIDSEIVVHLSEDDKHLQEYIDNLRSGRWLYFIGAPMCMCDVLNYFSTKIFPDIEYYQEANDDHIFHTVGWDKTLVEAIETRGLGWGVSHPDNHVDHMNTACMMSGKSVRAVGYFAAPGIRHLYADCQMRELFFGVGQLMFLCEDIYVEHRCWHDHITGIGVLAPEDDNTRWIYSKEQDNYGKQAMKNWVELGMLNDRKKLLDAIKADGKTIDEEGKVVMA